MNYTNLNETKPMNNQMVPMNICLSEKIGMNPRLLLITLHSHSEKEIRQKSNFSDSTFFFFYLGFLSRPFTNHKTPGEAVGHFFNFSLPLQPASQTLRY